MCRGTRLPRIETPAGRLEASREPRGTRRLALGSVSRGGKVLRALVCSIFNSETFLVLDLRDDKKE